MENKSANLGKEIKIKEEKINPSNTVGANNQARPGVPDGKKSNWWKWLLGCCGGLIVLIIIISVVAYFAFGKKVIDQAKELSESENEINSEQLQQDFFEELEESFKGAEKSNIEEDNKISDDPNQIVKNYLNSALGTLPESDLDDKKAKSYLSQGLQNQYDDPAFIQQTLCIQDGPSEIEIGNKDIYGEEAYITVKAKFGDEYLDIWDFALKMENDEWTIYAIYCLTN